MKARLIFEIGMPHLGMRNLSESALFKVIGNDRWRQIQEAGGVPTALIRDGTGERLYATFYFLELKLSPTYPLSVYGENETLEFLTDLFHYGKAYLDGHHTLAADSGMWIRSSNVFIYPESGPSKLAISIPMNLDFANIPELPSRPDSLDLCRRAKTLGTFFDPKPDDIALFEGSREFVYEIDADRDLNGAGLVYFANFISFLDLAERRILSELRTPVPAKVIDTRSTYHRQIGFYGNAQATERLYIQLRARVRTIEQDQRGCLLDLGMDYRIKRSSDDKEIVISSCRKVAPIEWGTQEEAWVRKLDPLI